MHITEEDITLIDRYHKGELNDIESRAFNKRVQDELGFKEIVEELKGIELGIQYNALAEVLGRMEQWEAELPARQPTPAIHHLVNSKNARETKAGPDPSPRRRNKKSIMYGIISAAAAIIILLGIFINGNLQDQKIARMMDANFEHHESNIIITRAGTKDNIELVKNRAYSLYRIQKYDIAAPLLEDLYYNYQDEESIYFAAAAYLRNHQAEKAIECAVLIKDPARKTQMEEEIALYKELMDAF